MATWEDFTDLFPLDYQPIIAELETAYDVDFSITDYDVFAAQSLFTIKTQLSTLGDTHALLLAIADYYLAKAAVIDAAGEGSLSAWDLLMLSMPVDDLPGTKKLKLYLDSVPNTFDELQAMSNVELAACFAPAHSSQQFWTNYALALTKRTAVLGDAEFGGFVMSLPLEERTSVESLLQMIVAADGGFDKEAMAGISTQALAGKIYSLNTNATFRYRCSQRIIQSVRDLISSYCADDQFDVQFYGSQGTLMTSALQAVQKSLLVAEVTTTVRDIGGLGLEEMLNEINTWNGSHQFFHGEAAALLAAFRDYLRMVADGARVPVTAIAFQIRPTNDDARPLGGLLVTVTYPDPVTFDPIEIGTRMLDFNGIAYVQYEGPTDDPIDLTFEVKTADEETLVTSGALEFDPATETSIEVEVVVPALPVNSMGITALATALSLTIPGPLAAYLAAQDLETLDDLRRMGGLATSEDSAVTGNLALCVELDQHAVLELISDDADLRAFLITEGYTSPSKIAAKTRVEFVTELTGGAYGEVTLAGVYLKASKVDAALSHLLVARGAEAASNYRYSNPLGVLFSQQCDCEECRSGVSPLAYLAALLDYGTKYIKNDGVAVDVDWFQDTFHQGYCELPANCAAVEKKVCQVRIAIEVMRLYLGSVDVAYAYRKHYLETTYGLLLNQCGVTVEEMRLAHLGTGDDGLVESMAGRMGIAAAHVVDFYLDSTGVPTLTEENLELLFGFQSTLRNPYSDGFKEGDGSNYVNSWQFEGVVWGRNTDAEGYLYLKLINPATVEVYRDSSRGADYLVASATVSGASPLTADLVAQNDSGLSGRIELASVPNTSGISVSVIPRLLAWRLQAQRLRWLEQDFPTRNTYCVADRALPIVEPDWMGPDDLRNPYVTGTYKPFDLWKQRREWVDAVMEDLAGYGDDLDDLFNFMDTSNPYQEVGSTTHTLAPWDSSGIGSFTTWGDYLKALQADLQSGVAGTRAAAVDTIEDDLLLDMDGFARLHSLLLASEVSGWTTFSAEELEDIYGILCLAAKRRYYPVWIAEEATRNVVLASPEFWAPIHEPKEGNWDRAIAWAPFYTSAPDMPLVDPVEVGLLDLRDPFFGSVAINFFQDRVLELQVELVAIFDARVTGSATLLYERMFEEALGAVPTTGYADYNALLVDLDSSIFSTRVVALGVVNEVLFLTEDEFREGMKVMSKELEPTTVTDDEWQSLAKIVLNSWRRGVQWDVWYGEEDTANLEEYWQAYKQRLPKWRSGKEYRRLWLEGLAFYNRLPLVDPDLIKAGDIVNPEFNNNVTLDNAAYKLWRDREYAIHHAGSGFLTLALTHDLDENLEDVLLSGYMVTELRDLYEQNKDVSARMAQLNLNPQRVLLIAKLIDMGSGWSDGDWDAFIGIIVQIKKERQYGLWNIEERASGITLGPDYFHPPYGNYLQYHQYLEQILLPWRTSIAARRDWQDRLDARIDQEEALIGGVAGMVKATEDRVLIMLRDALVQNSSAVGNNLEEKGEWLTEKLLLDFRIQCCNETTRVAQAIETLQVLYFSIRTGTILDDYPLLRLDNDDWDDDWKWLSTYSTWRSLMFVYLYPENVLLPSLKDQKSGKLTELMDAVRNAARFTPDMACEVLHSYEEYLKDMADLRLQATVTTTVNVEDDGCGTISGGAREVDFLFALGGHTRKVYMSMVDVGMATDVAQGFWEAVPEMEGIYKVIGATVFRNKKEKRFVYLLGLKSVVNSHPDLVVNRLDLATGRWSSDLGDLKSGVGPSTNTWGIIMAERSDEKAPIYVVATSYEWNSVWGNGNANATTYTVLGQNETRLKDRLVQYNRLDAEGVDWEFEPWKEIGFNWFKGFQLCGAIFTPEKFLHVLVAVQFQGLDWHLAYHDFYEGNVLSQQEILRVLPQNSDVSVWTEPDVNQTTDGSGFSQYRDESAKLRHCCILPLFGMALGLMKVSAVEEYKFYYNTTPFPSGWPLTNYVSFSLDSVWYKPRLWPQPYPGDTTPFNSTYFRSLEIGSPVISGYPEISFIGPFYKFAGSGSAPTRIVRQLILNSQEMQVIVNGNWVMTCKLASLFLPALLEHPNSNSSASRRTWIRNLSVANSQFGRTIRGYVEETYYLLPMFLAIELQKNKHYEAALDLFRLVYDYTLPLADRKIYYGLKAEETINTSFANVMAWLDDPENPHTIAGMRANTYTRFTVFSIVRCMLEMADQEFTADSPESVPRARTLYLAARELIRDEIYELESEGCGAILESLDASVTDAGWYPEWLRLKLRISVMNNHDAIDRVVNGTGSGTYPGGIVEVFADTGLSWEEKIMEVEALFQAELDALGSVPNRLCNVVSDWSIRENNIDIVLGDDETGTGMNRMSGQIGDGFLGDLALLTGKTVGELTTEDSLPWLGEEMNLSGDVELELSLKQRLNGESGLYEAYYEANPMLGLRTAGNFKRPFIPYSNHYFCVPQNPVPFNLLLHAELNLFKIRHCRNIAGIHRELDPYGAPTDTTSGMPVIGGNGNIAFPGTVAVPPTPYRYEVVLSRAKELIQLAAQAEGALLNTLEKLDAERYTLLRARQDLGTAKATVKLQDLRVKESEHEVDMAEMQQERAQVQVETYEGWLDEGIPKYEKEILNAYDTLRDLRLKAAYMNYGQQVIDSGLSGVGFAASADVGDYATGLVASYFILLGGRIALGAGQLDNSVRSIQAETSISMNQIYASWEQRKRDYTFQSALSQWDVKLAGQQIKLANDRLRITGQERAIAEMQSRYAEETVEFLRTKFTSVELYDWMSGVLQRVYSFYLQHATSMAKVAQQQLAFERQEAPANLILDDYWSPPSDGANVPGVNAASGPDRKGLTGSTRLQMDLTKLDLYAFETEKRKLQLTKTMSLAQLFPAEFEVFRQTGVLNFRTRMEWFDRDFPGHYLRLIKRVRTSVIALVPPGEGIRARLATTGDSLVVVGGDSFQKIRVRHGAESVTLTSPIEATGLFEMLPDRGDMLYPFEAMGVDAPWEFRMYRAANPINFNTIADVLVTFEYTALESFDYEEQVIQTFAGQPLHGERAFSFKYLLPDQWYDLRNAASQNVAPVVDFVLRKGDFPGLSLLKIEQVTMMFVLADGVTLSNALPGTLLLDTGNQGIGGLGTSNVHGVISTRTDGGSTNLLNLYQSNPGGFVQLKQLEPFGRWTLDLAGTLTADMITSEEIVDVLLIVGYKGDSPGYR